MVWTAPMTAIAGSVFTAAQFNTFVRDNLNETAPAKASLSGSLFVGTGTNSIAERFPNRAFVATSNTTASTTPVDLATPGPSVATTTGSRALVFFRCGAENDTAGGTSIYGYEVSGATSIAANLNSASSVTGLGANNRIRTGSYSFEVALNSGFNTFTMKYWVSAGTGLFIQREIAVIPL